MRKLLIPLLLASALAPAAAYAEDGSAYSRGRHSQSEQGDRGRSSENRSSDHRVSDNRSSDSRPQRAERVQRFERSDRADRPVRVERANRSDGEQLMQRRVQRVERPPVNVDTVREVRTVEPVPARRVARGGLLSGALTADGDRRIERRRDDAHDRWRDRDGDSSRWRDRDGSYRRWSGDWRRDHRYDWHSYRSRYGSLYRLGRYYDPYGWGYRRFSIGFTLWPSYYGSSFWLDDPWDYRLPPAYGPYRWVRYYDDALLVNIYTGQVVDVIHDFFW